MKNIKNKLLIPIRIIKELSALKISKKLLSDKKEKEIDDKYNKKVKFKQESLNNSIGMKSNIIKDKIKNISEKNINEFIEIDKDSIKNSAPYRIKYKNQLYVIKGANSFGRKKITWHFKNYLKVKKTHNSTIQGVRENFNAI